MNFFKSVLSEQEEKEEHSSDQSPTNASPWSSLNTLINTLSTKTESYRRDLHEFTSGLKAETSLITSVASRAARDFPASIESTASAAQNSLESVGFAIDSLGSTVSYIFSNQTSVSLWGEESSSDDDENRDLSLDRPYSRLESLIRAMQCDVNTYCKEIDDLSRYEEWKVGFDFDKKTEEIDGLIGESGEIGEIYDEVVPQLVDEETFWTRYFFRVHKVRKAEEARAKLVKRVIRVEEEEEELSWDVDEEDVNGDLEKEIAIGVEEGEKMLGSGKESDISIVSSQPSIVVEDIGWDEIEESGKADEVKKVNSDSPNVEELRKRLGAMGKDDEDEEELGWDIEDDDEPLKT